ncbi:MAG: hypothetical protein QXI58_02570 [Candidatus Micrarchaeia archaeon]
MEARRLIQDSISPGVQRSLAEQLARKWAPLLENLEGDKRLITAILLEQTAKGLKESSQSISTADVAAASRFLFPLVRRVWPGLVVNDIVAVQPMTMPVGAVCYFQVLYGTKKGEIEKGTEIPPGLNRWYSSDYVPNELLGTGDGTTKNFPNAYDFLPIIPKTIVLRTTIGGSNIIAYDRDGDGKLYSGTTLVATVSYMDGTIVFETAPDNGAEIRSDYRYQMELTSQVPEIELRITFDEVQARPRKLKAVWSPEAMEDMKALYAVDAEAELVQHIGSTIALEIDQEVIQDLFNAVDQTSEFYTEWDRTPPQGVPDIWHVQSIIYAIGKISNVIHKKTYRAPANWIIVSPEIASIIEPLPQFKGETPGKGELQPLSGIHRIGVLADRWVVYRDPYFPKEYILVGYKGSVFYDTGYVYAPYIPLQATPTFYDPDTFAMKKGLRTRYAKKLVRKEYYGLVKVLHI